MKQDLAMANWLRLKAISIFRGAGAFYLWLAVGAACAQGTGFTFQGRLTDGGAPANGLYDFQFGLRDALTAGNAVGSPLTLNPVGVTNGLFNVTLDFGAGVFNGAARWVEIGARTNGSVSAYTVLSPRTPVSPVPYAMFVNTDVLAAQIAALTNQVSLLVTQTAGLTNQVGTLTNEVAFLTTRTATLTNQMAALTNEVVVLTNQVAFLNLQNAGLTNQVNTLTNQVAGLTNQVVLLTNQVSALTNEVVLLTTRTRCLIPKCYQD